MIIRFSEELIKELGKLRKTDNKLFKKIDKAIVVFRQNPRHKSLRLHKLSGSLQERWSLSVGMNFRMIFFWTEEEAFFVAMGTHDQVYRK